LRGRSGFGCFLLPSRSTSVLERGGVLTFRQDHGDGRVHRYIVGALRDENLAERALIDGFHFHRGFVGFDLGDHLTGFDLVALLLVPFCKIALLHGGRERGHEDLNGHGRAFAGRRLATSSSVNVGIEL
jgi:hypothetical protein